MVRPLLTSFSLLPPATLLQALNSFLSLNPDVHMLPFTTLTHLTILYAVSHSLVIPTTVWPHLQTNSF